MLQEKAKQQIIQLNDAVLLEYILTGTRLHSDEAVQFASQELSKRHLSDDWVSANRPQILQKLFKFDVTSPCHHGRLMREGVIVCQSCGIEAPTAPVEYSQNVGMIVARQWKTRKGYFCRTCNRNLFQEYTLITALAGWWGIISFIVTIVYLLSNTVNFFQTMKLAPVPANAQKPVLDDATLDKLAPFVGHIADKLNAGANSQTLARDIAPAAGVTPGQAWLFIGSMVFRNAAAPAIR